MDRREMEARRADNQVWNGAGEYQLHPWYRAIGPDGRAPVYLNTIVGLAQREGWQETLEPLLRSFEGSARGALYSDLLWMGLERCLALRWQEARPALQALRRDYAAQALARLPAPQDRNEGESLRGCWWARALDQPHRESSREKAVLDQLEFPQTWSGDQVRQGVEDLLYRWYRRPRRSTLDQLGSSRVDRSFFAAWQPGRNRGDALRRLSGPGESKGQGGGLLGKKRLSPFWQTKTRERVLRDYVEGCFGASLLSPGELAQAEQELCTGDHRNCRLHFTKGEPISRPVKGACARERALFELQRQKNRAYFEEHKGQYRLAMARLSQALENTLLLQREEDDSSSRWGRLRPQTAWRGAALGEEQIFTRRQTREPGELWVDLLLDGSASQNGQQEKLAAQAYLIAAGLGQCQIPVRVSSFCSVSGCTVLRVYRDYQDKETDEKIFDYAAAGWNRDGLALRAMGWLLDRNKEEGRRLLIVLSDASPNDDQKIPSNSLLHGNRDYSGVLGVKDAAQEAAALRKKGVEVVCIFTGGERELPAARQIYGREVVRLPGVSFLAQTVSRLIQGRLTAGDRL